MHCDFQTPSVSWSTPQSHYQIKRAKFQDLQDLADLLTTCFHHQPQRQWFYPLLRLGVCEDLRQRLKSSGPHHTCWTAWELYSPPLSPGLPRPPASRLVGTVEVDVRHPLPWSAEGCWRSQNPKQPVAYAYVSNLAVCQDARRRGIAKHLLQAGEQTARRWGFPRVYLHVLENNQQARQLYQEAGYYLVRIDAGWETYILGRPRQFLLGKTLKSPPVESSVGA